MSQKLYVGNLPYRTTEDDLRRLFKKYEPIHSLILVADKVTEQPRGYSFVELDEPKAGDALYDLRNTEFNGRNLIISVATGREPKTEENASGKKDTGKKTPETRNGNKHIAITRSATPQRNRQITTTEYIVSDVNNYG